MWARDNHIKNPLNFMNTISKYNKLVEFVQLYDAIKIMEDVSLLSKIDATPGELREELLDLIIEYIRYDLCPYIHKLNEEIGRTIATGQSNETIKEMIDNLGGHDNEKS